MEHVTYSFFYNNILFRRKWLTYTKKRTSKSANPALERSSGLNNSKYYKYQAQDHFDNRNNEDRNIKKYIIAKIKTSKQLKVEIANHLVNLKAGQLINLILKNTGKQDYMRGILLRSGDIEENPGPGLLTIPEPMILEETRLSANLEFPEKQLYDIGYFNFEEFLIIPRG